MRRIPALVPIVLVLILTSLGTSIVARQAGQQPDVLNALLVEVRGLRSAMEQLAAAGPRVQLTMGRLQLQEQRINTPTLGQEIAAEQGRWAEINQRLDELDRALSRR